MAAPSMTKGAAGNALASGSLAASGTATFNVDASTNFEDQLQVGCTFGTTSGTYGLKVEVFRRVGSTPVTDTIPYPSILITGAGAQAFTLVLPVGSFSIKLTNTDTVNGLTSVYATFDTVSGIA